MSTPLDDLRRQFLTALTATLKEKEPRGLYDPIAYILQLGGKRLRPLVALLAGRMFGDEDLSRSLPVALAVEVFHNFTLVHDDIMDQDDLRRGKAAVHKKWNVNTGILSGDLMLIQAYEHLSRCPNAAALPALLATFNRVATGVCEGQQYDVDFETRTDVTIADYLRMIELKTAVLLGGALEMGALAAGASRADADRLYAFGRLTGLAFQVQDDLLDTYGETAKMGKTKGSDIVRNKKTFLYLKAAELLDEEGRRELIEWYGTSPTDSHRKVARVTELMDSVGIPRLTTELRDRYQTEAYRCLDAVRGGEESSKEQLRALTESMLRRVN